MHQKGYALGDGLFETDVLFIEELELKNAFRGQGIGCEVVRETIDTFGSGCALAVCKPFPIQYSNWMDEARESIRKQPGFERTRLAAFEKVARFWTECGFIKLPDSDFYGHAPGLASQPSPVAAKGVVKFDRHKRNSRPN